LISLKSNKLLKIRDVKRNKVKNRHVFTKLKLCREGVIQIFYY
jgi:hypothetical protein